MNTLLLLLTLTTSTLVLRSGDRIVVQGPVQAVDGMYTFRSRGLLYSLPAGEVLRVEETAAVAQEKPKAKLRVSEEERKRLIEELEKNHSGQASSAPPPPRYIEEPPSPDAGEEMEWRTRARAHEENIRRAKEELALLETRVEELRGKIHSLYSLGYHPRQFTYEQTQLARTLERIPYAQLEVTRAERAWLQLKEDARRAGVMPGWLR
jgi:hypothetical protein